MSILIPILIVYGFSQIPVEPEPKNLPLESLNEPTLEEVIDHFDKEQQEG